MITPGPPLSRTGISHVQRHLLLAGLLLELAVPRFSSRPHLVVFMMHIQLLLLTEGVLCNRLTFALCRHFKVLSPVFMACDTVSRGAPPLY